MKHACLGLALSVSFSLHAQDDFRQILLADPYLANGYFIVNSEKFDQLNLSRIDVAIIANKLTQSGGTQPVRLESFTISSDFYGSIDPSWIESLQEGETVFYQLTAYDQNDNVVIDYQAYGDGNPWPEACRLNCNAPSYAWTLVAYSSLSQTVIDIVNGTTNGSANYFYVRAEDWVEWIAHEDPEDFGFYQPWTEAAYYNPTEIFFVQDAPASARDVDGYPLGAGSEAWAIRKDRGPWRQLYAHTGEIASQNACLGGNNLLTLYNADEAVQDAMELYELDPLVCSGNPTASGGLTWGPGPTNLFWCLSNVYVSVVAGNNVDLIYWTLQYVPCATGIQVGLTSVSSVAITRWNEETRTQVLSVSIPDVNDPKLVPVRKTTLAPGLYEFLIILDDGSVIRHFEAFSESIVVNADFASFTDINVYPVPVEDGYFAVDLNLIAPMDITMTVMNNMGINFYSKVLHFAEAGKNKHVVKMSPQWPSGVYHAIFQYQDGSSEAVTFSVE